MKSIFRKSINKFVIEEIASVLDSHSIGYEIIDNEKDFDPSFVTNPGKIEYQLLIDKDDFEAANKAVSEYFAHEVVIPEDYYLSEYSNEELKEVLFKKDEWNEFDYEAAKKILKSRGENITEQELDSFDKQRLESLKDYENPEQVKNYIILGYIFAVIGCVVSLFWGILIFVSYAIALAIIKLKKQLPNGERVYYFNEKDRNHGKRILKLSLVFTAFWILFAVIRNI
ncbi:hypothetical protein [Chryseobacterium daecheongense]|uniref:Ribosome maturation factor RimP n=1 Tax=Chryseobacterium daecheongense TaxID=192389 RepID=A0A3N0W436_9FLAO|nr:hypothetical protein [Chryseobacterium daecheongense]ROH99734.1 hypothetical protein EGI05_02255 [Chryseobacterium daecheongense]TDX95346.1 ribosome maturation factor RimP [Chryseobacterium daecheongense]